MTNTRRPSIDLKKVLASAQLPALPQSAVRLLQLSDDPSNGPAEFAVVIEADPGLAGQVLRFVNSSYFGFSREIASVKLAITLVGIRTIKNFALWSAVFSLMPNPMCGPFDLKRLWQDSLCRALFARELAKLLGMKDVEEPFSAALLQDMAIPLLAREQPQLYLKLLEARRGGQVRLSDMERQLFGWTHGEAAAILCRVWKLPDGMAELVRGHNKLDVLLDDPSEDPARLSVVLSSLLPAAADEGWPECAQLESSYEQITPAGFPPIADLLGMVDQQFEEFAPVLKLPAPSVSLVDLYGEVTAATS